MKKITSRIIAMLLVLAMTMSLLPTAFATESGGTFTDVGQGHWAYDYVEQAVALGLFRGIDETTFAPNGSMTRGMFMTVLNRLSGEAVDNEAPTGFEDVAAGQYYTGAIAWAVEKGITTGMTETTFGPGVATTRQQAAAFLYRYAEGAGLELPEDEAVTFTDEASISGYAKEAVTAMAAAGIITGYTDGTFQPEKTITRAEAAAMFIRFREKALPAAEYYSVSFMANNARITVDGKETTFCAISQRESLTFAVEALENYTIVGATTSSGKLEKNEDGTWTLSEVNENVIISVLTESTLPETYTISFDLRNALVTVDGETVTQVTVTEGESLTFTAEADNGYVIAQVIASAGTLTDNGDGTYTLTEIEGDAEITVVAVENQQPVEPEAYTISFVTDEGVKVYVDGVETDTATVTSADNSFTFVYELTAEHTQIYTAEVAPAGHLNRAGNAYVLTGITGDTTITLTTGIETFTVTFSTEPGATPVATQIVEYMTPVEQPEDPSMEGHFFGGWYADELLVYDYDFETPVTADMTLYAAFGTVVDTVYLDGLSGSNANDGATPETPVYSGSWATKMAAMSTSKTIVLLGMPYVTLEETWDASAVEGGITVLIDESFLAPYSAYAIYVEGNAKLTVNNWNLICERSEDNITGATLAVIARSYLYDEDGNAVYDENGEPVMFFGDLTMNNCTATGFGTLPKGADGYDSFNNYCFDAYGALTLNGGEYWDNIGTGGAVINMINDTSALTLDGVEFHHNESRYMPGITYADGTGGVIGSVNLDKMTIRNCYFHDNVAEEGGAMFIGNGEYVYLENNIFENNHANTNGGAICIPYGKATLTLENNNQFIGNTASNGAALWLYNAQTIPGGTFRDNKADTFGDAVYATKTLTIQPDGVQPLALDDGFYAADGKGIQISGSVANNQGTIVAETTAAVPGLVLAKGVGYTLTEADFAKIGCSLEAELELDTEANAIKIKEIKDDDDEGGGGDGGEGSHNMTTVYLSGTGSDSNDGATAATAVQTFAKAKGLLAKDGTIVITNVVKANGETWSLEPETFGNAKVVRGENYTNGYLIQVTGSLTLKDITIDGQNVSSNKSAIYGSGATISLGSGTVLENLINSGAYGVAVYNYNGTVIVDDAIIRNCSGTSSYGAMIYTTSVVMNSGLITGCTSTGTYGGGLYATNVNMAGGTISNNSFTGAYGGALCGGYQGSIVLSGGIIEGNTCYAAAVSAPSSGTLTMTGGEVKNNTASNANSSGAGVSGSGTVELLGGLISGNKTSGSGAGYHSGYSSTTIIDGVTIENNESGSQGGGVYTTTSGKVEFRSGIIRDNTAGTDGDDIYVGQDGYVSFVPNSKGLTIAGEIYLPNNIYFKTSGNIFGDLTNLNGKLLFNFQKVAAGSVVAVPADGYTLTGNDLAKVGCIGCNMSYELVDGKIITKTFPVEGIELDKTEMTVMATYTDTLKATLTPADASNLAVTWTSTNSAVARVTGNLLDATVTAVAPGEATIRATAVDGGVYAECVVTVTENTTPIEQIILDKETMKMEGGDTSTLTATINPWNAYDLSVTWTVSNPDVVRLTGSGSTVTVTALEDGTATVTATAADGKTAKCDITVADTKVTGITVSPEAVELEQGETASVNGVIEPSDATVQDVIWTVDDESVATVTVYGTNAVVYGKSAGTTTVTATTVDGGFEGTVEVTVTKAQENEMTLDLEEIDLIIYQSFNITALFENRNQAVTWQTSDPNTVEILGTSGNQVTIKAVEAGSAIITATAADGQTAQCVVDVEVRVAGTQDVVYVEYGYQNSDANDGLTPETPIKNLSTALERVGVDGTIYVQGTNMLLNDGDNITLPKEIYGDARIVVLSRHVREEFDDGYVSERDETPFFSCRGTATFSDVIIDYTEAGDCNYVLSFSGVEAKAIISNGAQFLGSKGKSSQQAMYMTDWTCLMNGGLFDGFVQDGAYGSFRCIRGEFILNGGTIQNCGCRNYGGALGIDGANFTMNGGLIIGNTCTSSGGAGIYAGDGTVTINGGTISGNIADRQPNANGIYMDRGSTVRINAKYDLEIADGIQFGYNTEKLHLGSLHGLIGQLKIHVNETVRAGMTIAQGNDKQLTWEEMGKINFVNGNELVLDHVSNTITVK